MLKQFGIFPSAEAKTLVQRRLTQILQDSFPDNEVHFISDDEMTIRLAKMVRESPLLSIWQNRTYRGSHLPTNTIEVTRAVLPSGENTPGLTSRNDNLNIEEQIARIPHGDYSLVDDVIFSGESTMCLVALLAEKGITIKEVHAAIVIGNGHNVVSRSGIKVSGVVTYDNVVDEVCERDFIIGIPYGGRAVIGEPVRKSLHYVLPWGKPTEWASIPPKHAVSFSKRCLALSIDFWEMVNPKIKLSEVPQLPVGAPDEDVYFVDYLHQMLEQL